MISIAYNEIKTEPLFLMRNFVMTLDELQWMCELFKTKNMSRAVENLYISQPALSQCLRRVERQLGFKLFERFNKGLTPTKKGELFYEASLKITDIYQEFLAQASLLDKEELKSLRIGLPPYMSMLYSTDLLKNLYSAYPEISFSLCETYTDNMKEMLLDNQIQLMVTNEPTQVKGAVSYPFGNSLPTVIFLRKNSPATHYAYIKNGNQYLDPRYIADEPISITKIGQSSRELADSIFEQCGITPHLLQETQHISTLYHYAQEGITSAIGPCTPAVKEMDQDNHLLYLIPESYRWSKIRSRIHVLPEINRLLPRPMLDIIKRSLMYKYEP